MSRAYRHNKAEKIATGEIQNYENMSETHRMVLLGRAQERGEIWFLVRDYATNVSPNKVFSGLDVIAMFERLAIQVESRKNLRFKD